MKDLKKAIEHDTKWSIALGPLRLIVPVAATLVLYRVVFSTSGIEILGLWGLIVSLATYLSLTDIGFSELLTREIKNEIRFSPQSEPYKNYHSAKFVYLVVFFIVSTITLLSIFAIDKLPYNKIGFAFSIYFICWGVFFQLNSKLAAALLAAHQDFRFSQLISSFTPLLTSAFGIIGALAGYPIEGLAMGFFLNAFTVFNMVTWRIRHNHPQWYKFSSGSIRHETPFFRCRQMISRGVHLYTLSLGAMIREPIFRLIITFTLGLDAVGVYAIATRASSAARQILAGGFNVLYPSFSTLLRLNNRRALLNVLRNAIIYLYAFGAISLGTFWVLTEHVLLLWLNEIPQHSVIATRTLIIWNLITLFNLPFFFLLKAAGEEKTVSIAIWMHTGLLAFMIPLASIIQIKLIDMLVYWTASSLFTQLLIYYRVHRKLHLFFPAFMSTTSIINLAAVGSFLLYCFYLTSLSLPSLLSYFSYIVPSIMGYLLVLAMLIYKKWSVNGLKKGSSLY